MSRAESFCIKFFVIYLGGWVINVGFNIIYKEPDSWIREKFGNLFHKALWYGSISAQRKGWMILTFWILLKLKGDPIVLLFEWLNPNRNRGPKIELKSGRQFSDTKSNRNRSIADPVPISHFKNQNRWFRFKNWRFWFLNQFKFFSFSTLGRNRKKGEKRGAEQEPERAGSETGLLWSDSDSSYGETGGQL